MAENNEIKTIIEPELYALASVYDGQKGMLKVAEKLTKATREELDAALAPYHEELEAQTLRVMAGLDAVSEDGGIDFKALAERKRGEGQAVIFDWISKGRNSIDREKLLERGVSPEIIEYATKESSWEELRMKMVDAPAAVLYITE